MEGGLRSGARGWVEMPSVTLIKYLATSTCPCSTARCSGASPYHDCLLQRFFHLYREDVSAAYNLLAGVEGRGGGEGEGGGGGVGSDMLQISCCKQMTADINSQCL